MQAALHSGLVKGTSKILEERMLEEQLEGPLKDSKGRGPRGGVFPPAPTRRLLLRNVLPKREI